jgi:hypothetical protein
MIKKGIYIFVILLLILPIIQQLTNIPNIKNLFGAFTPAPEPKFTLEKWFTNKYQEETEAYVNEHFGFRNSLVRMHNQIQYSIFNEAHARGVIVGKKDYLYELNYIKAYYGTDFKGYDSIDEKVKKIALIRDTLEKLGVHVIPIFACGKGSFFPEFIPDSMRTVKKITNYEVFTQDFKKYAIPYIDFHSYIRSIKGKSKYPIYTKYGIHWSQNTMVLVADSILKYIEKNYSYSMPKIKITHLTESKIFQGTDFDIAQGMNLLYYPSDSILAYPEFTYINPKQIHKPKVITIADSYWWGIYNYGIPQTCFDTHQFWYYYNSIYPEINNSALTISDINIKKEIENQNFIFIMATDATLPDIGWGFINTVYNIYYSKK